MADFTNIDSPVWGMAVQGYGIIVQGLATIRQRMSIVIRTTKTTDPLRPEFGTRVYSYIDAPLNIAIPNIKREILECLAMWVKDIKVVAIRHYVPVPGNVVFEIIYKVLDEELIDKLLFDLLAGETVIDASNELILQAFFPANPNGYRYQIKFEKNGSSVFPNPNPSGYATINELFAFASSNWFYIGRWYLLADKIVCYMDSNGVTSASLAIEVLPIIHFEHELPGLNAGQFYNVQFLATGIAATPAMPQTFTSAGEVVTWAQDNWSNYATWSIEFLYDDNVGVFSDEFSDELAVSSTGFKLVGVSNVEGFTGELTITII